MQLANPKPSARVLSTEDGQLFDGQNSLIKNEVRKIKKNLRHYEEGFILGSIGSQQRPSKFREYYQSRTCIKHSDAVRNETLLFLVLFFKLKEFSRSDKNINKIPIKTTSAVIYVHSVKK